MKYGFEKTGRGLAERRYPTRPMPISLFFPGGRRLLFTWLFADLSRSETHTRFFMYRGSVQRLFSVFFVTRALFATFLRSLWGVGRGNLEGIC